MSDDEKASVTAQEVDLIRHVSERLDRLVLETLEDWTVILGDPISVLTVIIAGFEYKKETLQKTREKSVIKLLDAVDQLTKEIKERDKDASVH